jgi:hypothetical protein
VLAHDIVGASGFGIVHLPVGDPKRAVPAINEAGLTPRKIRSTTFRCWRLTCPTSRVPSLTACSSLWPTVASTSSKLCLRWSSERRLSG